LLWVTEIFENERTRGGEEEKRLERVVVGSFLLGIGSFSSIFPIFIFIVAFNGGGVHSKQITSSSFLLLIE